MSKTISSQPGSEKFRSVVVISIVLICISSFFSFTAHLSDKAEVVSRERVINNIRHALAMMLYDYTIKGELAHLKKFDQGNPFIPLAIYSALPANYHGSRFELSEDSADGWYFEIKSKSAIYIMRNGGRQIYTMSYVSRESSNVGSLQLIAR